MSGFTRLSIPTSDDEIRIEIRIKIRIENINCLLSIHPVYKLVSVAGLASIPFEFKSVNLLPEMEWTPTLVRSLENATF